MLSREETLQRNRERHRLRYERDRTAAITHYGGRCECCGEDNPVFLAIDHIEGGGTQSRSDSTTDIGKFLRLNRYPSGFRVLCHNCNWAVHRLGTCPHQV